jgi:hypothetical protein
VSEVGGLDRIAFFRSDYGREYVTQIRDYELKIMTHITTRKMSMQQIIEMLEKMAADRKADQEKMAADRKADKKDLLTRMEILIDANRKKVEADKEGILARIKEEDRQANQELLARMDAMFGAYEKSIMACLGQAEFRTKKIQQDTEMMQSAEEHQDVPSEDVIVRPVKGLKKRRRGQKSTAGRHREPKELTQGYYGSRRKVTVAGKRTPRHATVAWLKSKLFRRSGIQENFGPRKELTAAGIRMTHCAQALLRKGRSHEGP